MSEKTWKTYQINELFDIQSGVRLESRNRKSGTKPFIGALDNSNGIVQFVSNENRSLDSNFLGVNYNGNGMGIGFYHPYQCICTDDVKRFHLKNIADSTELALFCKTTIEKQRGKFGYLYKFNAKRMSKTDILLPVDDADTPDYDYMTEYIRQKRETMLKKYREYVTNRIAEIGETVDLPGLNEKKWQEYTVKFLFGNPIPTKGKTIGALTIGDDVPYIAAAKSCNGYAGMYSSKDHPEWVSQGNTIVFIQLGDGAAGLAYYEPCDFIGMSGKTSCGYNPHLNVYTGVFLAKCLSVNKELFSHGHSWTGNRLKQTKIMLPANETGKPDYDYMKQYAKNLMLRKYKQYLSFLDKQ